MVVGVSAALQQVRTGETTLSLLAHIHEEACRRRILVQLNRGERRPVLTCTVFLG